MGDRPFRVKHHVPRQLSDWHHIRSFLKLDRLLIAERRSIVENDIWVERAVFRLTFWSGSTVSADRSPSWKTYASHRRGRAALSPPRVPGTLTFRTERQPLHCRCSSVAREDICEALMIMPGSRTSVVRVLAVRSRNCKRFIPLRTVTCIDGIDWAAWLVSASLTVG